MYFNEARPSDRGRFLPIPGRQKSFSIPGCVQGASISLVCLYVCQCACQCVCATFVVFTDCESCPRPISSNPGSMEAGEYGLMSGTCFVARRLEVVAVAGLLWTSWCVLGGAFFFIFVCVCFKIFFSLRTHTACCKYEAPLSHLPLYLYTGNR